jgi:3-hydroxyisobutyrate dehydrogenase-like beta-hydroxyacid dehydrogenase
MTTQQSSVTVLGLGPMGRALADAFLTKGHPTTVWNRSAAKADDLVARGANRGSTAADAVAASPLVVVCVLDYDAVHAILDPIGDVLKGRTLVNLTADTPERARDMATWAAERGADYLDGAVLTPITTIGGPAALVLYSGIEDAYQAHQPTLASLGGTGTYLGPDPGRAAAYEIALLSLFWTTMSGYVHALALARAQQIAARDLAPYAQGIVRLMREISVNLARQVDEGRYPGDASSITSAAAGMEHVIHAASQQGIDVGVLRAAAAVAQRAIDAGHGDDGFARLVEILRTPTR